MRRRQFIQTSLGVAGLGAAPLVSARDAHRPRIVPGISSGDVSHTGAVIWGRTDRPALMQVQVSPDAGFRGFSTFSGSAALQISDFNAKTHLTGLFPGQRWYYRVLFESLTHPGVFSEPLQGQFKTAPTCASPIRFCWSGDTAGQGYGIDVSRGGMRTYRAMAERQPDFFIHSGDLIYADNPIEPSITLPDGSLWKNLQTEGTQKVAETVEEFRANYYYNFLDSQVREFHQQVPVYQQWDDHEVVNNWYPGYRLDDDDRYRVKSASLLAERSRQALFECNPIRRNPDDNRRLYRQVSYGPLLDVFILDKRSYRGPNSRNLQTSQSPATALLGQEQLHWLKQSLSASKATWKIIASDMPIGLIVTDWGTDIAENGANADDGAPLGRELEMADLLRHIAREGIANTHFITADVHYCASYRYDPRTAGFKDFKPFWEFVSGPLHAGSFGPNKLDNTFGPTPEFIGIPEDLEPSAPPSAGFQFFGQMDIDPDTRALTVSHNNREGETLWKKVLPAEGL